MEKEDFEGFGEQGGFAMATAGLRRVERVRSTPEARSQDRYAVDQSVIEPGRVQVDGIC